jgi:hypothetical protein
MSFDLAVLSPHRPLDASSALRIYVALCEGQSENGHDGLVSRPELRSFATALLSRYPDLDLLPDDQAQRSPWSVSPTIGDSYALLAFVWSRASEGSRVVRKLASGHGLTVYDPQADRIVVPASRRPWQFWRR